MNTEVNLGRRSVLKAGVASDYWGFLQQWAWFNLEPRGQREIFTLSMPKP